MDPNCIQPAEIAEGLAKIKQTGYTIDELSAFTTEPSVQIFPIQSLKLYVYSLNISSLEVKNQILTFCTNLGFEQFNKFLLMNDEIKNIKAENELLNSKIKFLSEENLQLKETLNKSLKRK